nr:GNAT family N-acetyltransferase [Terrilactibacillus laevilacticus]
MKIRDAVLDDLPAMLSIYNDAIVKLTSTFDLDKQTYEQRKIWFDHHGDRFPLIVAEINDEVVGYCSLSPYRQKLAYAQTVELSIYVSESYRRQGIGKALMSEILQRAHELGYHTVISGIVGGNMGSIQLHERFGFIYIGCFKEVGYKFNAYRDVHFYQYMI